MTHPSFIPIAVWSPLAHRSGNDGHALCGARNIRARISCSAQSLDSPDESHSWRSGASRSFRHSREEASDEPAARTSIYGGGGDDSSSGSGGGGGFSGDSRDSGASPDDSLPEDLRLALANGLLSKEALSRYHKAIKNPLMNFFMTIPSFRTRFLADSAFAFKLLVQELVGNGTALASEIAVRGKDIVHELEYVASDLIVGTVVEAAFVWLLAPTMALPNASAGGLRNYLAALPSNVFQQATAAQSFTLSQRAVTFFYAGAQYALIGFVAGLVGTAITYGIIEARKQLDKTYKPERPLPAVIPNSAAWGAFMAVSSNTRFQVVEGMELGIARLATGRAQPVVNAGIVALRVANNYWGGVQFVQFFRYLGLHATGEEDANH